MGFGVGFGQGEGAVAETGRQSAEAPGAIEPWGPRALTEGLAKGDEEVVRIGPLELSLQRTAGELRTRHRYPDAEGAPDEDEDEWSRWALSDFDGTVTLTPAFPERLVVVSPEEPFHLVSGTEARVYLRVPLVVEVEVGPEEERTTLVRLPSAPLSDTWWGSLEEGELGYWMTTHARRAVDESLYRPDMAICPLQLVNRSDDTLPVEKIALRVEYLSLYTDGRAVWSDETRVRYQGDAEGSRLDMAGRPPAESADARLLAEPRSRMGRGFRARTFSRLRTIHDWIS